MFVCLNSLTESEELTTMMLGKLLTHKWYLDVVRHPSTTAG
jgi:hypothetical protein